MNLYRTTLLRSLTGVAAALWLGAAASAETGASAWSRTDHSAVRLVAASSTLGAGDAVRLGLEFQLKPGWKTYWRSPGDAGYPPRIDWSGSRNLAGAEIHWPAPERFTLFGLDTFGYGGTFVLPITLRPSSADTPLAIAANVDYLICEQICIPYSASLRIDIAAGPPAPSAFAHLIDRFRARVPGEGGGATIEQALFVGGANPELRIVARALEPFAAPDLFVEGPQSWTFGRPTVTLSEGGRTAILRLPARPDAPAAAPPIGQSVTLTLVDGERASERAVTVADGSSGADRSSEGHGLLAIVGLALLGGLILNLMPCVLPVLSLKLLNVVGHAGAARARVTASFLASAAGVLASFWALAALVLLMRMAGYTIGWGIQFQQPLFLVFMVLLLTLFAANLWGWLEIRLPGRVADAAARAGGAGHDSTLAGSFATGAFATLLATPCSAPFLGTAVGFALSRGPVEIVAVFSALGLGLALPYLAVAIFPGLAARLPRPGRWMLHLRLALGVALAATALWLLTVMTVQTSALAAGAVGGVMLAVLALLWATRNLPERLRPGRALGAAVLALIAFALPLQLGPAAGPGAATRSETLAWQSFDAAAIPALVARGNVVFVDVTADWCITCQVNKSLVTGRGAVAERLAGDGVVRMRADWTRPDEGIARYLQSFGRYGIPFNVVYGPAAPQGLPLPEILTVDAVLAALDRAKGS